MKIQNGMKYENNYARAAAYFISTCAPAPDTESDKAAYELITGIYEVIFKSACELGIKTSDDVYFEPWEQQKERMKDVKTIREPIAKIEILIKDLFDLVMCSEASSDSLIIKDDGYKPSRLLLKTLSYVDVKIGGNEFRFPKNCAFGLKKLADISRENITHITDGAKEDKAYLYFSRCVFEPKKNWTAVVFDNLLGAHGELVSLCSELERRGYTRIDCRDGKKISLDYVKQHGKKQEPVKQSWGDKTHSGIELSYEELRLEPCFIWLRVPMFKTVLENFSSLPEAARDFIKRNTKNCDGCRYCVQTDKSGMRPLAAVDIGDGSKCPYYPAFSMNFRSFDKSLSEDFLCVIDSLNILNI